MVLLPLVVLEDDARGGGTSHLIHCEYSQSGFCARGGSEPVTIDRIERFKESITRMHQIRNGLLQLLGEVEMLIKAFQIQSLARISGNQRP
jgi:hypothetical protein